MLTNFSQPHIDEQWKIWVEKKLRLERGGFSMSDKGVRDLLHSKQMATESFDKGSKITWLLLTWGLEVRRMKTLVFTVLSLKG